MYTIWDFLPLVFKKHSQFPFTFWRWVSFSDTASKLIPWAFNGVEVWALSRPFHSCYCRILKETRCQSAAVNRSIVLLKLVLIPFFSKALQKMVPDEVSELHRCIFNCL